MQRIQQTISPIDGRICAERPLADFPEIAAKLTRARTAHAAWHLVPLEERIAVCRRFAAAMVARKDTLGEEITHQMGRPIRYTPKEIVGMADRATTICDLAEEALADINPEPIKGFTRFIRREPVGVVFAIVPWNYPYLTAVNSVVPALLAGNAVILKHSPQTPLCGERLAESFAEAGLPGGVFQFLHVSPEIADRIVRAPEVDFVAFTGSVRVGRTVQRAAAGRFIGIGLELGGKDAAYVRQDANLEHAIENVVDGAFFNSGQSCCAVERIYVHANVFERFVEGAVALTKDYSVGNPLLPETTLGPVVNAEAAKFVRGQVAEAVSQGARALIPAGHFPDPGFGSPYVAPQILVNVNHTMRLMREETFGPVVGIMPVGSDEEAIRLINDSPFGLTASVWTTNLDTALQIGDQLQVGTLFANRCDYLDPQLAWTGTKDSGHGVTLSKLGFDNFTRAKSFHLRSM